MKRAVCRLFWFKIDSVIAAVDPLPLVPVMWIMWLKQGVVGFGWTWVKDRRERQCCIWDTVDSLSSAV